MKNKKLFIYFIVIFILLFVILFVLPDELLVGKLPMNEVTTENSKEFPFVEYETMKEKLLKDNYHYKYNIIIDTEKYEYEGFINDNIEYDTIDNNLVNMNYIMNLIKDYKYDLSTYNETRMYKYNVKYDDKDLEIIIYTDLKNITKVSLANMYYQYSVNIN